MTRRRILLVVLLAIFAGFGFFIYRRAGSLPASDVETTAEATADAGGRDTGSVVRASSDATPPPDTGPQTLERTLRVVSPDLELLAPGIVANGGLKTADDSTYADNDLTVEFAGADGVQGAREALAKGGSNEEGADIAILSLPSFVGSYEQLRALKPEVFFVTAWSRGREALTTRREDALTDPPDDETVQLRGAAGEPATFLSLFAMDLAGISLESVDLTDDAGDDVPFAAVARSRDGLDEVPEDYRQLVSTSEALGLIPFVAIAPHGFVENHPEALYHWTSTWLQGKATLNEDVPKAARLIASKAEDADALELIDLLGWIEFASPVDNARVAGLSGRTAANLDRLFRLAWRIWRDAGVLTTPTPKAFPITTQTIMEVVRAEVDADTASGAEEASRFEDAPEEPEGDVLAVYRSLEDDLDEESFVEMVGLLADIFRRSRLRVTVDWNRSATNEMIEKARKRFDIAEPRLVGGRKVPGRGSASVEIFEIR